jgi:glycosidase
MNTLWPKRPVIYEINTWVWLNELRRYYGRSIKLGDVPAEQLDSIAALNVDAVWLMGVWERSPEGVRIANRNAGLQAAFRRSLPDYAPADNVGSAYCVHRYVADENLGGPQGLAKIRELLAQIDIRLVLDFVPNHVAPDHPWIREHPEYFVQGTQEDLLRRPEAFFKANGNVIARGRDPNYPPWPDVAQLNAFQPGLRQDIIETCNSIANQCDAIRSDMAMLLLNSIFESTWGASAGLRPQEEYWHEVISHVRAEHPTLRFIAEAYWNKEWELQQIGFDYCYDKTLYERLVNDQAESIRLHLTAGLDFQDKLLRFIENHDEPRASATFSPQKGRAAAVAFMTLPGAKLLYEGQLEGRKARSSVFLARRPVEPIDFDLQAFYHKLLTAVSESGQCSGEWQLCERTGWPDNNRHLNLVAWCWRNGVAGYLIVINLSDVQSQGRIKLAWRDLDGNKWQLTDLLSGDIFVPSGDEMQRSGLYVDLPPWGFHFLQAKVYFP